MTKLFLLLVTALSLPLTAHSQSERNCGYDGAVERAYLSCVACGVKDVIGRTPSLKYLSLLATAANQYSDLDQTSPGKRKNNNIAANFEARGQFYRLMAEQIQAYGFCMDKKLDKSGNVTANKGYGHLTREEWSKVTPLIVNSGKATGSVMKEASKVFGFDSRDGMEELLANKDWAKLTAKERQAKFRQVLHGALRPSLSGDENPKNKIIRTGDDNGEGLQDCLQQIDSLQTRENSMFNYSKANSTDKSVFLCKAIAKSCGTADMAFCEGPVAPPAPVASAPTKDAKRPEPEMPSEPAFNLFDNTKGAR